ncbi:MAG: hypothetical protein Q8N37_01975 [bacterium]|nr:hypothetical protein [bacterium]
MQTQNLIKQIEKARNSKVITYITSDRQGPIQTPQEQVMWRVVGQGWK